MCYYVATFQCNSIYNAVYKILLKYHSVEDGFYKY